MSVSVQFFKSYTNHKSPNKWLFYSNKMSVFLFSLCAMPCFSYVLLHCTTNTLLFSKIYILLFCIWKRNRHYYIPSLQRIANFCSHMLSMRCRAENTTDHIILVQHYDSRLGNGGIISNQVRNEGLWFVWTNQPMCEIPCLLTWTLTTNC